MTWHCSLMVPRTLMYAQGYMRSPKNRMRNQKMWGDHEEVVPKISFAEILQQVKDRDVQERQFGIDEDTDGIKSEHDYIGKNM